VHHSSRRFDADRNLIEEIEEITTVRSITEQIQLVIVHNETRIVGHL
jgi:hypothetical protein